MSQITDYVDELRKKAIELLVTERAAIDDRLAMLGYDGTPATRPLRQRTCGVCGSTEHNAQRCPKKNSDVAEPRTNP